MNNTIKEIKLSSRDYQTTIIQWIKKSGEAYNSIDEGITNTGENYYLLIDPDETSSFTLKFSCLNDLYEFKTAINKMYEFCSK